MDPNTANRLLGRSIRVGVFVHGQLVKEAVLPSGADVVLGGETSATVMVPGWHGAELSLVEKGEWIVLGSGMGIHACHDRGEDRIEATYEELVAAGVQFPMRMSVSRYNLRIRDGLRVLMGLRDESPIPGT